MAAITGTLDPFGLHRTYAVHGHRRRRQRRFYGRRRSAGSRARLPRRPDNIGREAQRPRIHGSRAGRITRSGVKLFVTESHKALNLALPQVLASAYYSASAFVWTFKANPPSSSGPRGDRL